MNTLIVPDWVLLTVIGILLLMSAYFASTETAMMKLNPYRLRTLAQEGHGGARRAHKLLERKDRLLGVILIGNNLVNFSAVVIANVVFIRWFGTEVGGVVTTVTTTFVFLIFAEIAPKTIAAERPESIAFPSAYILVPLQSILKYVVAFTNFCGAFIVGPFTKNVPNDDGDLSEAELRTIFLQGRKVPDNRKRLLTNILDLEEQTVSAVMVPRQKIVGIDLTNDIGEIRKQLLAAEHTRFVVYENTINDLVGILHMRDANKLLQQPSLSLQAIRQVVETPDFVPSGVTLSQQLQNFRNKRSRFCLAVDEYGTVVGLITIEDIVEEIVGEFIAGPIDTADIEITKLEENAYRLDGSALIHDVNQATGWQLPDDGPRTISGLVIQSLRRIPDGLTSTEIDRYQFTVEAIGEQSITRVVVREKELEDKLAETESTASSENGSP